MRYIDSYQKLSFQHFLLHSLKEKSVGKRFFKVQKQISSSDSSSFRTTWPIFSAFYYISLFFLTQRNFKTKVSAPEEHPTWHKHMKIRDRDAQCFVAF